MLGLGASKFYDWKRRYGQVNEHNGLVPRDHWLDAWEKLAILSFNTEHRAEGNRRLTYMMSASSALTTLRIRVRDVGTTYRL